ncbi:MAG: AAA-like domain-containing protein [Cyanobacteria bacterium P01_G01_bin.38]
MTDTEALALVKSIVAPETLSYVQEIVFKFSWEGRLYPQIAKDAGYHPEYIRDVGAQLWRSLSDSLGQKITKKNVRFILSQLEAPSSNGHDNGQAPVSSPIQNPPSGMNTISFPSTALPLKSSVYLSRLDLESQAFSEVDRPSGLLRIKAPGSRGKTSLVLRVLDYARQRGMQTVLLNFQEVDGAIASDLGRFLRWFSLNVTYQLGLESKLDDYWDEELGNKISCKLYFREYLLKQMARPWVLALDQVDQIFEYPDLVQEFLPMLRAWHEEGMEQSIWQNLRLVMSYSTEVYVPLKISQSPFNIGLALHLPELTLDEIKTLVECYELPWGVDETSQGVQQLQALVGGHPYLVQTALYWLKNSEIRLPDLLANAPTQSGIYAGHLRRHWQVLQRHPGLLEAIRELLRSPQGLQLEALCAYRLESLGLIKLTGNVAQLSCNLYQQYFQSMLSKT